jgi:hypothetical protein
MNLIKWICDRCNKVSGIREEKDTGVMDDIFKKFYKPTGKAECALRRNMYGKVDAVLIKDAGKFHAPNAYRVKRGAMGSDDTYGNDGAFQIPSCHRDEVLQVIASDGLGWEHVSVSLGPTSKKCPSWDEMCQVRNLFWDDDVAVIQFHPPREMYVNRHQGCLHMWRRPGKIVELPPMFMVG